MMCTYFDIMADTAGYGGRTVSPLSGLNRIEKVTSYCSTTAARMC